MFIVKKTKILKIFEAQKASNKVRLLLFLKEMSMYKKSDGTHKSPWGL